MGAKEREKLQLRKERNSSLRYFTFRGEAESKSQQAHKDLTVRDLK